NGGTFDLNGFAATTEVVGADGQPHANLEGVSPTMTFYAGSDVSGPGTSTVPTVAGTYTVVSNFPGSTNYASASLQTTFTIGHFTRTIRGGTPAAGANAGGTRVTITGTNLGSPATATVDFGAGNPGTILSDDGTTLLALSPTGTGTVDLTVSAGSGASAPSA